MVPKGWSECRLEDISTKAISYGIVQTGDTVENGVKCLRVVDITKQSIELSELITTTEDISKSYKRTILEENEIVLALRGEIGKCLLVSSELAGCNLTRGLARISPNGKVLPEFLFQLLASPKMRREFELRTNGSALREIPIGELRQVSLCLPTLHEQQKIAAILSTWDRAIQLTEKLIATEEKRKQALMQQLLTGKLRLKEFVKSLETFSTRYGNYPTDWKYVRLEQVAQEISIRNADGTAHQVLSCTKYHGLVDSLSYFGKQIFSEDLSTYKIVRRNEFAYATNHIEEGSIGYQNVCDVAVISPMYTVFKTKDGVDDGYLYKLLKSDLYVHIYQVNTSASVDRRGSLRWGAFSHIRIPLPSLAEQQAIAAVLDRQQDEINVLNKKCQSIKLQKKGLMQQLITGKVRVRVE